MFYLESRESGRHLLLTRDMEVCNIFTSLDEALEDLAPCATIGDPQVVAGRDVREVREVRVP